MGREKVREELMKLYERVYGKCEEIAELKGGGSSREYYRLREEGKTAVGVCGKEPIENETFIRLSGMLRANGVKVPEVLAKSQDIKYYLIEDLGDTDLLSLLHGEQKMRFARKALECLIDFQLLPEDEWKDIVGYPPLGERLVKWDLNYFKYDFLKPFGIEFDEEKLEDDFELLGRELLSKETASGLMYRDFQSRNIMVKDGELWFIDFQGARKGPMVYDAVSFVWQAKAPFSHEERENLGRYYIEKLKSRGLKDCPSEKDLLRMAVFRTLQVLGAYGFRGLIERKKHFIESIPMAIANLRYLSENGTLDEYPELKGISEKLGCRMESEKSSFCNMGETGDSGVKRSLKVSVCSFSYKKGYPENVSGNGGGFIFDCRAIHNPGRYEEYKHLTGKDTEVIEFLENTGEADEFIGNALRIVRPSVKRYLKRGFTSLQVGFGCTGGQHRSVYCAEKFAKAIKDEFPEVEVEISHREQDL